jgi:hypothetical protein
MNYTTLADLRKFGDFVSVDDDTLLTGIIGQASRMMDKYCNQVLVTDTASNRVFRNLNIADVAEQSMIGRVLYLDAPLATTAAGITDSPTVTYLPENEAPYWAMVLDEGSWTNPTTVSGYWACYYAASESTVPDDLQYACLGLCRWLYEMRDSTGGDVLVVTPEGQVLLPKGFPQDVITILGPYRRIGVGI